MISELDDIQYVAELVLPWEQLCNKTILISGATGMLGTFLIDVLMQKNLNIKIIALGRDENRARERFSQYWDKANFMFLSHDINQPLHLQEQVDFIIHAASNTHPLAYAEDPIGTILTNIIGTNHMLEYAQTHGCKRFLFLSSVEIYGENRGDVNSFDENYCGYIDCNTLRAGYPEGKRAGEALCQAYRKKYGMDIVIARLSRMYGPTMLLSDTKAISQFIKKGMAFEDIILKSKGNQFYSYSYVADGAAAVFTILFSGMDGEAYNIADENSDITLKDMAEIIARYTGKKVVFELPDEKEAAGYSKATKATLNSEKLQKLGWKAMYPMEQGLIKTIESIRRNYICR